MSETINCRVTHLHNGGKLYYQFNCDSAWLTYELKNGKKFILSSVDSELYQYTFRIGYQFSKEYKRSILFRSGCPANGPCNFILISKANGKILRELGELIYDHDTGKFYDFLVYFSDENKLAIDFVDDGKKFYVPISSKYITEGLIPEYSFDKVEYKNNILTLYSIYDRARFKPSKKRPVEKISFDIGKLRKSLNHSFRKKSAGHV